MDLSNIRVTDGTEQNRADTPWPSLLLAYAALVPLAAGAAAVWLAPINWQPVALEVAITWGGAVVCFLAGVRRGLSFRQPGGSTLGEIATMFVLFVLGVGALLCPVPVPALLMLGLGFLLLGTLDARSARHGEAPRYFARLRPVQMLLPLAGVAVLLARVWQ